MTTPLTPSTLRLDIKCGKGAISQGEKCHKGVGQLSQENKTKTEKTLSAAAVAALGAGAILTRKKWTPVAERTLKEAVAIVGGVPIPPKGSKFLAKGYAGAIYVSRDKKSVFKINFKRNLEGRKQFRAELEMQAKLHAKGVSTPNVLAFDSNRSIAQIEYLDGYKNLTAIAESGSVTEKREYAKQFMVEMSKLHKAGYAHGDMHLGNVMFKNRDVKLIDWGYATPLEKSPKSGMRNDMTHIGNMLKRLDSDYHSRFKALITELKIKDNTPSKQLYSTFWEKFFASSRSDSIFMSQLTPVRFRIDIKCGEGAISQGEKCHKGPATKVAVGAAALGAAAGVGALVLSGKRRPRGRTTPSSPGQGMELLAEGTRGRVWLSADKKTVTKSTKDSKAAKALFEEARLQSKVHKAGVSTPKIISTDAKRQTITMENLEGYKPVLTAAKGATPAQKEAYAVDLVTNLSKAHGADIAHGDLNTNVLAREGKLSIIDWGQASKVRYKGMADILNAIRIADDLNPALAKAMKQEFKPLQTKFGKRKPLTVADFNSFYSRVLKDRSRSDSARLDLKCGKGAISQGEKCHKGTPTQKALTAGAVGLGVGLGALAIGMAAMRPSRRRSFTSQGPSSPPPSSSALRAPRGPQPSGGPITPVRVRVEQPQITGSTPAGLLRAAPRPKSKTQRMRENTAAAARGAEQAIGRAAQAEITRAGAVANAMASAGEATGMATKTTMRELRLRVEAARRRFEPGYRSAPAAQRRAPAQLPEGGSAFAVPFTPATAQPPAREAAPLDPRTGQPRRRRARGFGRSDNYIPVYAPVALRGDGSSTEYYRTHPEAAAHKVRHQAEINRRPGEKARRVELNRERRRRGIYGKGGPDVSHTSSGDTVLEAPSKNRARNGEGGRSRLKADSPWAIGFDADDGKKYTKTVTNPETGRKNKVRYGAKGYTIAPGTDKGDRYCARSFGDMKSHGKNCAGADRNTPLCLSRAKWKCSGKSSRRS